jgi:hypothetical protein
MRTKTLLIAAAVLAAGIGSSVAQTVYSANIVGYINLQIPTGASIIANQLDNGTNDLASLVPNANFGDTVYRWNGTGFDSSVNFGSWSPDFVLLPGQAVFYVASAPLSVTLVGQVETGNLTNSIPAGISLVSDQVPVSASLDTVGFPSGFGDTIYFYRSGTYSSSVNFGSGFSPAAVPAVGEGFWIDSASGGSWVQDFSPQ